MARRPKTKITHIHQLTARPNTFLDSDKNRRKVSRLSIFSLFAFSVLSSIGLSISYFSDVLALPTLSAQAGTLIHELTPSTPQNAIPCSFSFSLNNLGTNSLTANLEIDLSWTTPESITLPPGTELIDPDTLFAIVPSTPPGSVDVGANSLLTYSLVFKDRAGLPTGVDNPNLSIYLGQSITASVSSTAKLTYLPDAAWNSLFTLDLTTCSPFPKYTVFWNNDDGTNIRTDVIVRGDPIPATPTVKPAKAAPNGDCPIENYLFHEWIPSTPGGYDDYIIYTATYKLDHNPHFGDIPGHPYEDLIKNVNCRGLMVGTGAPDPNDPEGENTLFRPNDSTTNQMAILVLSRLAREAGLGADLSIPDTDLGLGGAIPWAHSFTPNLLSGMSKAATSTAITSITRQDVAQLFYNFYASFIDAPLPVLADRGGAPPFTNADLPTASPYYEAIEALWRAGIMNGIVKASPYDPLLDLNPLCPDGSFCPEGYLTRAELAVILSAQVYSVTFDMLSDHKDIVLAPNAITATTTPLSSGVPDPKAINHLAKITNFSGYTYHIQIDENPIDQSNKYQFAGWYLDKDFAPDSYVDLVNGIVVSGPTTFYAKWELTPPEPSPVASLDALLIDPSLEDPFLSNDASITPPEESSDSISTDNGEAEDSEEGDEEEEDSALPSESTPEEDQQPTPPDPPTPETPEASSPVPAPSAPDSPSDTTPTPQPVPPDLPHTPADLAL